MPASGTLSQKQATRFSHEVLWAKGYRVNTLDCGCNRRINQRRVGIEPEWEFVGDHSGERLVLHATIGLHTSYTTQPKIILMHSTGAEK